MTLYEDIIASMGTQAPPAAPVPPAEIPPAVPPLTNEQTGHFSKEFDEAFPRK